LTPIVANGSAIVVIPTVALHLSLKRCLIEVMRHWRLAMRELSAEVRLHLYARSLSKRAGRGLHGAALRGLHGAALYGAFAVIAALAFGTLSLHPF
jgi:hypothetical protein